MVNRLKRINNFCDSTELFKKRKYKRCECGLARPYFNIQGEKQARWCVKCPTKPPNAIGVKSKRCECGLAIPTFNIQGEKQARWCAKCPTKPPNAVNVKDRRCECGLAQPSLNLQGEKQAIWCAKCPTKPPNAIDVKHKRCECGFTIPCFNIQGEKQAIWCAKCPTKPLNAVNVKDKRCECGLARPTFNLQGEKQAIWCAKCPTKPLNAVNVKDRRCECGLARPTFNLRGEKQAIWCVKCPTKPLNAVNVKDRRCACGLALPTFNLQGEKQARWCAKCPNKPPNAVNVNNKRCECGKLAHYGIPGHFIETCFSCKKSGMISNPRKKCIFKHCKELAIFGLTTHQRCELHKHETDFNLTERICISCGLMYILNNENKCDACEPSNFKRYTKRKENIIKTFLDINQIIYVNDHIPNGVACGKERPDFVIDCKTHIVIIEVDENQHSGYQQDCEINRMFNITQTFGGMSVFWIRYNPDNFKINKKQMDVSDTKRQAHLLKWLHWAMEKEMENLVEFIELFYDDCNQDTYVSELRLITTEIQHKTVCL